MKRIFTLLITAFAGLHVQAQAILNEVYAIPGSARQEFFEFYNNSTTSTSMDNYTMVTYFEEGGKKGFYVLDIPALSVAPKGFFVGSSQVPFNYQGVSNSTNSQFSWNDITFLANNNGYLKKWVIGTSVSAAIDGNASYDLDPIPSNFNDFFNKIGGQGATYNVFVYKNGMLQNTFLGGTGGATFLPSYIIGLPSLFVDMTATSPDFTINFSGYANVNPEYVIQDVGSDNGYIRLKDGYCGTWTKSSAQVNHSPGVSNGGASLVVIPDISIAAAIVHGTALGGSTINYDAVAGPLVDFPVTLNLYVDNGSVPGDLDAGDTYLISKRENTVADGPFSTLFFPYDANVLVQVMTSAGCIDNIRLIPNVNVLPVKLISFSGTKDQDKSRLQWTLSENESALQLQVEKSNDGINFRSVSLVAVSDKQGRASYQYIEPLNNATTYYRIKITDKSAHSFYSDVVFIEGSLAGKTGVQLAQNPVDAYLSLSCYSETGGKVKLNIYNVAGSRMMSEEKTIAKGHNTLTLSLDGKLYTGTYILEIGDQQNTQHVKFLKR
jgi:hypothetical protein